MLVTVPSNHGASFYSARFMPESSDHWIVSAAGDGNIHYTNITRSSSSTNIPATTRQAIRYKSIMIDFVFISNRNMTHQVTTSVLTYKRVFKELFDGMDPQI